jgi:hypothetical protein
MRNSSELIAAAEAMATNKGTETNSSEKQQAKNFRARLNIKVKIINKGL